MGSDCRIDPCYFRPAGVALLLSDSRCIQEDLGWAARINSKELVQAMVRADLAELSLDSATQ
ncbi:MAG TPA: hypothetical protein EYG54_00565 [Myxococcales bacterium]|nr:hypothetical protein [Myxococcales bacterium]